VELSEVDAYAIAWDGYYADRYTKDCFTELAHQKPVKCVAGIADEEHAVLVHLIVLI